MEMLAHMSAQMPSVEIVRAARAPLRLVPNVRMGIFNPQGDLLDMVRTHNLVTQVGRTWVRDALYTSNTGKLLTQLGIGTGTTAAADGDTALETSLGTFTLDSATASVDTVTMQYLLATGAQNGNDLTEAGLITADTQLYNRWVYAAITKTISIQVLYQVVIAISEA